MLKSYRVGGVGGPQDLSVSPSPFGTDFDWIGLGWSWALGVWDLGRGLTIKILNKVVNLKLFLCIEHFTNVP